MYIRSSHEHKGTYYYSLDILNLIAFAFLVLYAYGLPGSYPYLISLIFNVGVAIIFTVYGFLFFGHDRDYRKSILSTLKLFIILFVVYGVLAEIYTYISYGQHITVYFTKRALFNFVVLNIWPASVGTSIWMVQSALYALIALKILDDFDILDYIYKPLCVILFVLAVYLGECSGIIKWNVLGYTYISGNFLTRAIPYMLLGKWIYDERRTILRRNSDHFIIYLALLLLSALTGYGELYLLNYFNVAKYYNHLVSHIPMTIAIVEWFITHRTIGKKFNIYKIAKTIYPVIYRWYTVISEFLALFITQLVVENTKYISYLSYVGLATLFICILVGLIESLFGIKKDMNHHESKKQESHTKTQEEYEDMLKA